MPKHKVGSIVTFKNGAKAKVLPSGKMRIISGPTKKSGRKKKGGSVSVGGSMRKRKGGSVSVGGSMRKKKGGSISVGGMINRKY